MKIDLKKHKADLLFVPLGGASEIGMNVSLYHLDGKWLMIDLGLGFAHDLPGIDMLAPNISFAKDHKKDIVGLILTHIHEDHLGAVQHLWEELRMPIYTSEFTANFLRAKLEEYSFARQVKIITINPEKNLNLKPFDIEFIGLTHSTPEMHAIMIKTEKGNILHSGDWKFDPNPVIGKVSEKEKIKAYGDKKEILALVCDSTNALSPGHSGSEGELFDNLKALIQGCKQMVGVTTFASNIARVHTINEVAKECGRKVVLCGFSLRRLVDVGKKSGYFKDSSNFISDKEARLYKRNEILVLSTGCQGEYLAATNKFANDAHQYIKFIAGDMIIFSSKIIPGNEKNIFNLFNKFAKKKIEVITEKDHFVHVSGHPNQDELREMYDLAKPQISIPVHGEPVHIAHHCQIAEELGVSSVIQVENGSVVKLSSKDSQIIGTVTSGYFGVDGKQLIALNGKVISQRRRLQDSGIVIAMIVINSVGKLLSDPYISSIGVYDFESDNSAFLMLEEQVIKTLNDNIKSLKLNSKIKGIKGKFFGKKQISKKEADKISKAAEKSVRAELNKIFKDLIGKKPLLDVIVKVVD